MSESTRETIDAKWLEQVLTSQLFLRCDRYGEAVSILILASEEIKTPTPSHEFLEFSMDPVAGTGLHPSIKISRLVFHDFQDMLRGKVYQWSMQTQFLGWMDRESSRFTNNGNSKFVHPMMLVALGRVEMALVQAISADDLAQGGHVLRQTIRRLRLITSSCVRQVEGRLVNHVSNES